MQMPTWAALAPWGRLWEHWQQILGCYVLRNGVSMDLACLSNAPMDAQLYWYLGSLKARSAALGTLPAWPYVRH